MSSSNFKPLRPKWDDPTANSTRTREPSGAFVSTPAQGASIPPTTETVLTYNAALAPEVSLKVRAIELGAEFTLDDAVAAASELAPTAGEVKIFEYFDLLTLGDAIGIAAVRIGFERPDLVLFPMRGGYKLYGFLDAMVPNHPPFRSVPFSEAATNSTPAKDAFFLEHIRHQIRANNPGQEYFRLHIVDVGKGGNGSQKMLELLRRARELDEPKQRWCVVFHIFHLPGLEQNFRRLQIFEKHLQAVFECYPTDTLLIDDLDPAVGLRKELREMLGANGSEKVIVPMPVRISQPLAVVVKKDKRHQIFGSAQGEKVADQLLSYFTTDAMFSPSYIRDPSRDVWDDWLKRRK